MHISADGLLWLGTDNGLYIYDESLNRYEHAVHSSQNTKSLVNNIIWHIFEDRDGKYGWVQDRAFLCITIRIWWNKQI